MALQVLIGIPPIFSLYMGWGDGFEEFITHYFLYGIVVFYLFQFADFLFGFPLYKFIPEENKSKPWQKFRSRIFLRCIQFLQKQIIPTLHKHLRISIQGEQISKFFPNFDTDLYSDEFLEKYKGIIDEPSVFSPQDRRAILFYNLIFLICVLAIVFYPFKYLLMLIALTFQWIFSFFQGIFSFLKEYGYSILMGVLVIIFWKKKEDRDLYGYFNSGKIVREHKKRMSKYNEDD